MKRRVQHLLILLYKCFVDAGLMNNRIGRFIFEWGYLKYKKHLEAGPIKVLRRYVPSNGVVVDVGANIGFFTMLFAEWVVPNGKVVAFEPERINFASLRRRVENSKYSGNIQVAKAAVAEFDGSVCLNVNPYHPGDHRVSAAGGEQVQAVSIDNWVETHGFQIVSLIKIDVQGYELSVLKGAECTIDRFHPVLFLEIDPEALSQHDVTTTALVEWLYGKSYKAYEITRLGVSGPVDLVREKRFLDFDYQDYVFVFSP